MVNYTIYRVALINKAKEEEFLSRFNGINDLLKESKFYYEFLSKERVEYYDIKGNKRTFSISSDIHYLEENRILISDFDSAYTGETFDIRDGSVNKLVYKVSKEELQSRKMFSLLFIPKNAKYGYVVFENKSKHGVKSIFEKRFNKFLKERGYIDYRLTMTPGLNFNYLSNMIEKGKLKKVRLINNTFSNPIQLSLWGDVKLNQIGEEIRELKFKSKIENSLFKKELHKLFFSRINKEEKILFMDQYEVDDISFEINYNNSSKTFYLKDRSKMRSNIDVTKRLDFIYDEPSEESKRKVAIDLIREILDHKSNDFDEVA